MNMMQLVCNGVSLDLLKDTKMTFKKVNPLFAFDKITCERTTEFTIPDTALNNAVFGVAKRPEYKGDGMRRRFATQYIDGTCVKEGYLYVSSFKGGAYHAIFVTGELMGLKSIKDAGKIGDYLSPTDKCQWGVGGGTTNWRVHSYERTYGMITKSLPSMKMTYLMDLCKSHFNVNQAALSALNDVWIIPKKGVLPTTISTILTATWDNVYGHQLNASNADGLLSSASMNIPHKEVSNSTGAVTYPNQLMPYFRALKDISIKTNLANKWMVVILGTQTNANNYLGDFLGDYTMTTSKVISGTPITDRYVEIPKDTTFAFLYYDWYRNNENTTIYYNGGSYTAKVTGWYLPDELPNYTSPSTIELANNDAEVGDTLWLKDNLPDVTYIDLLKTAAAIGGKQLNYDDVNGITFDNLDFNVWGVEDMSKKVISIESVERKFGDYGQKNYVEFTHEDWTLPREEVKVEYDIDNDNLEESQIIQQLPFSEGGVQNKNGVDVLLIRNTAEDDFETQYDVIYKYGSDMVSKPITMVKSNRINQLCNASTCVIANLHLTHIEYEGVTAKSIIRINGVQYVWVDSTWDNGVGKFTLARV